MDMEFEFVSTSATSIGSTNTALGQIGMLINYNPDENAPDSIKEALNYAGVITRKPADSFKLRFDKKNSQIKTYFVQPGNSDLKFASPGKLVVFSYGAQLASVSGNLFIRYKIKMIKKVLHTEFSKMKAGYLTLGIIGNTYVFNNAGSTLRGNFTNCFIFSNTLYFDPSPHRDTVLLV
jgi:hypothetical protein